MRECASSKAALGRADELRDWGRELVLFGRAVQRRCRRGAAADGQRHLVVVAGADLSLVASGGVAARLAGELRLLEFGISSHAGALVGIRQLEHAVVERVESGQGDEL